MKLAMILWTLFLTLASTIIATLGALAMLRHHTNETKLEWLDIGVLVACWTGAAINALLFVWILKGMQ